MKKLFGFLFCFLYIFLPIGFAQQQFDVDYFLQSRKDLIHNQKISPFEKGKKEILLYKEAFERGMQALQAKDFTKASRLLHFRQYKTPFRFDTIQTELQNNIDTLQKNEISEEESIRNIQSEILTTYKIKILETLQYIESADAKQFDSHTNYLWGKVYGYLQILKPYGDKDTFKKLLDHAQRRNIENVSRSTQKLSFNHLSKTKIEERLSQLLIFFDLVGKEYRRGVRNGKVSIPFEIQEAVSFSQGAYLTLLEVQPFIDQGLEISPLIERTSNLQTKLKDVLEKKYFIPPQEIQDEATFLIDTTKQVFADYEFNEQSGGVFGILDQNLSQLLQTFRSHNYVQAKRLHIETYALFDSRVEIKLMAHNPRLLQEIELLFWQGDSQNRGIVRLIEDKANVHQAKKTVIALQKKLNAAQDVVDTKNFSPIRIISNAAIIVFREGFEALIIIFGIIANTLMYTRKEKKEKKKVLTALYSGVFSAIILTVITGIFMKYLISFFEVYGERVEAVISLIAVGVLLVIMNWFFRDIYWHKWSTMLREKNKQVMHTGTKVFGGLFVLGLSSIFREGFEIALFLQVLLLDAPVSVVLQGIGLGLIFLTIIGIMLFALQKMLPFMKMLMVSLVLIWFVLITMIGQTIHTMQIVQWVPITSTPFDIPYFLGSWFGVYPTWQGVWAQGLALVIILGSFIGSEVIHALKKDNRTFISWLFKRLKRS